MKKLTSVIIVLIIAIIAFFVYKNEAKAPTQMGTPKAGQTQAVSSRDSIYDTAWITKKPFGIYITPANSPVQPEKFTGYHTGVDFETTPAEANLNVPVPAFCDGKLLLKKYATGYGGVAVESCVLNGRAVTIIYGHLRLASITPAVGQALQKGDFIGNLGRGYSTETDGERKHLHVGIHLGTAINILGYVQKQSDLSAWLDPAVFVK
jgi:hypothetical protein